MPKYSLSYPRVRKDSSDKYFVDFKLDNTRYRLFNGARIGSSLSPNSYPTRLRRGKCELLAREVYDYLVRNDYSFTKRVDSLEMFNSLMSSKLSEPLSSRYRNTLSDLVAKLRNELVRSGEISVTYLDRIVLRHSNNTSFNTTRRHLNVLVNYLRDNGFPINKSKLKARKQEEVLHKPIENVSSKLELVKSYNKNLYICCLLTYGCLLRPHKEIRLLKWGDFSNDLSFIRLSGDRVKSKRNRVVPVPLYVRSELVKGPSKHNIFSGGEKAYNDSYFSLVWKRFKRSFPAIDDGVTLYSFRHSGAMEIYRRTGSLHKLQRAMGHSSLNVSLTYLRGLEVAELEENDMPMIL